MGWEGGRDVSPSQTSALPAEEEGAAFPKSPEGGKQQCVKGAGSQGRQHLLRCPSLVVTGHWGVGGVLTSLAPHERLPEVLVVPREKTPIDGSPPGSLVPGILQARTLEWVAISFSNA